VTACRGALLGVVVALLTVPTSASADVSCRVSGSAMQIAASEFGEDVALGRAAEQITVTAFVYPDLDPVAIPCSGPTPTIHSVDSIAISGGTDSTNLFLEFGSGPFAPGLSAESDGTPEIEITLSHVDEVIVNGSGGPDQFVFGIVGDSSAADFNAEAESQPDVDLIAPAFRRDPKRKRLSSTEWEVHGQGGPDLIDATGGPGFTGPATADFRAKGQDGDDRIIGGDRGGELVGSAGNDFVVGGAKPDALIGGKGPGRDTLVSGGGDDVIFAGRGRDRIFGGSGSDLIASGPGRDRVHCGPQPDGLERTDGLKDHRHGCELVISFEGVFD
jgi:Ca2+-binding RTX toxin-like protein